MKETKGRKRKHSAKLSQSEKQTSLLHFFSRDRDGKSGVKQINKKKYDTVSSSIEVSSPCSLSKIGDLDLNNNSNKKINRISHSTPKQLLSSFCFGPVNGNDNEEDEKKRQILEGNLRLKDFKNYINYQGSYGSTFKDKNKCRHSPKNRLAQFGNHLQTDSLGSCSSNTKRIEYESTSSILNSFDFPKDSLAHSSGIKIIGQGQKPNLQNRNDSDSEYEQYSSKSESDDNDLSNESLASSVDLEISSLKKRYQDAAKCKIITGSEEKIGTSSGATDSESDSLKDSLANLSRTKKKCSPRISCNVDDVSEKSKSKRKESNNSFKGETPQNRGLTSNEQMQQDEDYINIISNDDDDDGGGGGDENRELSEYEKLRLRNIARNEARMAALGLTVLPKEKPMKPKTKKISKKMPSKVKSSLSSLPTRRSTRVRNKGLVDKIPAIVENNMDPELDIIEEKTAETLEIYTVSPLVQYNMMDNNASSQEETMAYNAKTISLQPYRNQCLRPPSRLDAIYSLNFCQSNDSLLAGAGKAGIVALWNLEKEDPIMTWKAHSGRWIANAQFVDSSKLLTAGNDGCVCLWDLTSTNVKTDAPKLSVKTNKILHQSGIFSMHYVDEIVATASKDKSIAITSLESLDQQPIWRSTFHSSKVSSVCLQNQLVASSSDDGAIAIHDYRSNDQVPPIVLEDVHVRPHSAIWDPTNSHTLLTAGLDDAMKIWDTRNISSPVLSLNGHVPLGTKMKKIQRPLFYQKEFILTGGERSGSLSMFRSSKNELISRGSLPDGSDVGSLACYRDRVAISLQGGEVLLLHPCKNDAPED